jgi:phage gp36-like protein
VTYATQQDLIDRFGLDEITQISDETGSGTLDTGRVAQALADANAQIDGFLGTRYTLPLSTIPAALNLIACDVSRYRLARLPADEMRRRYEDALRWLGKVATGEYGLGVDAEGQVPAETSGVQISGDRRVFTREMLDDFIHPRDGIGPRR